MGTTAPTNGLDIAEEKGSYRLAVLVLWELFPKVYGSLMETHIRSFRSQAKNRELGGRSIPDLPARIQKHLFMRSNIRNWLRKMRQKKAKKKIIFGSNCCAKIGNCPKKIAKID